LCGGGGVGIWLCGGGGGGYGYVMEVVGGSGYAVVGVVAGFGCTVGLRALVLADGEYRECVAFL
jgi:hypothetical protein